VVIFPDGDNLSRFRSRLESRLSLNLEIALRVGNLFPLPTSITPWFRRLCRPLPGGAT